MAAQFIFTSFSSQPFFSSWLLLFYTSGVLVEIHFCVVPPLQLFTQPTDTSAAAPFSGVFTCSVSVYGHPNISWHRQIGSLPHKHKTTEITSYGISTSTLIIPNVTEEDVGKYYCQVWANNKGLRSEPAHLYYSGS